LTYPAVLTEDETLDLALGGMNLARFGDGELKLALGRDCVSQVADKGLAAELLAILRAPSNAERGVIPCIPNVAKVPEAKRQSWAQYGEERFARLYGAGYYGSAFITRPDSAPWIDRPDYWAKVRHLWEGRDVILAIGTDRSLRAAELPGAVSVSVVWGPRRDAYVEVDRIEAEIAERAAQYAAAREVIVLMCLGATATVLAERLARRKIHAVDLGHIGMFMRHAGAYHWQNGELISDAYLAQLRALRARGKWGADGHKHAAEVLRYAAEVGAESILDYGCGEMTLAEACKPTRVLGYDPGVPGREALPKPCELVVSTDVLEHIEPDRLDAVLTHIYQLAGKAAYFVIATRPANAVLPDGRNAHLIVERAEWWAGRVAACGWRRLSSEARGEKEVRIWAAK
jgi:hypothetical protein